MQVKSALTTRPRVAVWIFKADWVRPGNIVIIGVLVAGVVGYSAYRQKNQPGGIAAGKKRA